MNNLLINSIEDDGFVCLWRYALALGVQFRTLKREIEKSGIAIVEICGECFVKREDIEAFISARKKEAHGIADLRRKEAKERKTPAQLSELLAMQSVEIELLKAQISALQQAKSKE